GVEIIPWHSTPMGPAGANWKPGHSHKFFIRYGQPPIAACPSCSPRERAKNHCSGFALVPPASPTFGTLVHCNRTRASFIRKEFTGELISTLYFIVEGGSTSPLQWRAKMAWKAPKIVEVPCGMEINMYVSATRK